MTTDQFLALVVALTGLCGAVGALLVQVAAMRRALDGRLSLLIEETKRSAHREGELRGRDWEREPGRSEPA